MQSIFVFSNEARFREHLEILMLLISEPQNLHPERLDSQKLVPFRWALSIWVSMKLEHRNAPLLNLQFVIFAWSKVT